MVVSLVIPDMLREINDLLGSDGLKTRAESAAAAEGSMAMRTKKYNKRKKNERKGS